jgi:hypothetical protein
VVDTGDEVRTVCVRFSEESITGEELMRRTDLDVVFAHYGTLGAAVCEICGVGCPAEDCHCATPYWWSYWHGDADGGWATSPVGASSRAVRDGDMNAWLWHDGSRRPPEVDFATVCPDEAAAEDEPAEAAPPAGVTDLTSGQLRGLLWFAITLVAILGAVVWVRRSRAS